MNKTIKIALAGLVFAAMPVAAGLAAAAGPATGPYVKLEGGASFGRNLDINAADMGQTLSERAPTAAVLGVGAGWQVTPFFRAELALSHRFSRDFDATDGVQSLNYKADVSSWRGFANAYLDIAGLTQDLGSFQPYLGVGLGVARNRVGGVTVTDLTAPSGFNRFNLDGASRTGFAWQVMAGTGIALTDNLIADIGYRYVDAGRIKTGTSLTGGGVALTVDSKAGDLQTHEVTLGLRYRF